MITKPSDIETEQINPLKTAENAVDFQLKTAILNEPFKKLAMALSGGGFRAAAYSLGAMSYLHYLRYPGTKQPGHRVLDNVEFIGSASGGTFAGILYSMHVQQGKNFQDTFNALFAFLNGQVALENVLENLNGEKLPGDKSANLINAFARIYNKELFEEETFEVYWPDPQKKPARLMEVCFNSTEFYRGISFRFQASNGTEIKGNVGNKYIYFDKKKPQSEATLKKLKLGDIMAASSCFPAGFEPILFPKDFTYLKDKKGQSLDANELKAALVVTDYDNANIVYNKEIGLMDGGINDNQAVYSAMLADIRRRKQDADNGFDLIFITDVASYFMTPYEAPETTISDVFGERNIMGLLNKSIKSLLPAKYTRTGIWMVILLITFIGGVLLAACSARQILHDIGLVIASFSAFISILLLVINKLILNKSIKSFLPAVFSYTNEQLVPEIKKAVPAFKNFSNQTIGQLLTYVKKTPFGTLEQLVKARLNSMLSLVLEINLKQTRRLIFGTFYGEFYGKDIWQNRRVFNVIYELSTMNIKSRADVLDNKFYKTYAYGEDRNSNTWAKDCITTLTAGCNELEVIAENARTMGTTLWTDKADEENHRIQNVIACGQFTTCAKLLEYCFTIERILEQQEKNPGMPKQVLLDNDQLEIFQQIKKQLLQDWTTFKSEPLFVFEEYVGIPKKPGNQSLTAKLD